MSTFSLEISSQVACTYPGADYFARIYGLMARRAIVRTSLIQARIGDNTRKSSYDSRQMSGYSLGIIREAKIPVSQVLAVDWLRYCNHETPRRGDSDRAPGLWRQVERMGFYVVRHVDSEEFDVKPVATPQVDENDIGSLQSTNAFMGQLQPTLFCPEIDENTRYEHPVTKALGTTAPSATGGMVFVGLRGLEREIALPLA